MANCTSVLAKHQAYRRKPKHASVPDDAASERVWDDGASAQLDTQEPGATYQLLL
eukprot:CAMPEP_0202388982 /NCGR_PEP_ID=MMETSP1127-20130417/80490_1 /ASSEMBLY_ACC=CAM_ASM_000462 /TAXON_ID=3047 /ORGANISM="Dunaliella tertiolecta, Strain CCMP1320" /LENGTH=54 /DNA_ID=CAMNT_0048990591 /DNA_START=1185 /DNA_END=1349 /DNA_ORIENTATION=-